MEFRLSTSTDLTQLRDLTCALDAILTSNQVARETIDDVVLIAEEIFANAINHGYDPDARATGELAVELRATPDRVLLEFRDNGRPFNPLENAHPDLDAPILDRPIGGLGVHLIRELSESVEYSREDGHNVLHCALARRG